MKKTKLTRSLLAACSVVALSAVAYGCSSGVSDADHQAALDKAKAAEELAAAEKKAAEEAAAAAKKAAEEAAAQAERDKQEAVEAARQAAIAEQEKMAVMAAIAAAMASVDALMDDSSDVDVTGAMADIAKATAAIAGATSFSADDTAMYTAQVTAIQANLTLAEANIRAYRAEMAAEEAKNQATAAERAKTAVENAIAALTAASEAQDMASATYSAAASTLADAQQAVADADSDSLAEASAALAEALIAASTASADLGVKTQAVADTTAALMAAEATLAEADPDHVALIAARNALATAQADKDALTKKVADLQKQIEDLRAAQLQAEEARQKAEEDRVAEQMKADMAAAGKALHAALGANPLAQLDDTTAHAIANKELNLSEGTPLSGATPAVPLPNMKAGDSAGMLGDWMGTNYADMDTGTKVANSAVVYTNQGDPTTKTFASEYGTGNPSAADGTYASTDRKLTIAVDATGVAAKIKGPEFATAGTKTHTPRVTGGTEVSFSGMYDGVSGTYICTAGACTSTYGDGGITLAGTWEFVHPQGAMISRPDPNYLFFGWWLRKDKDDMPTHASAFTGMVGTIAPLDSTADPATLATAGSATYTGAAAGKFAINNPLGGSDAGHFTADATLTAKFGGTGAGVTGTINNFMANDKAVPWSVALNNRTLADDAVGAAAATNLSSAGAIVSVTTDYTTATPTVDDTETTVWSIDGNAAPASGTWSGQMYDEMPGSAPTGDGSNVPTSVTGVFQSTFGSTHTMVGAFGAEKQ